jgi:hypothetical protein
MTNATYTSLLSRWPLPTIVRGDSTPQERQFKPMDVLRNRYLVEIWLEMVPPRQMASTPRISRIWPRTLPSIMRRHSTPLECQFKPMDVLRNRDLVEIWLEMVPPHQMASTPRI